EGNPSSAATEILAVEWHGTEAFRAETQPGTISVSGHCPGIETSMTTGRRLWIRVNTSTSSKLQLLLYADEDGLYHVGLYTTTGRAVSHQILHL
ncbi:MAG: hypothetical protein NZ949_07800, partial [Candidatus Kapabacteria bacterium]|nr:hypothetical protein [Candidatus Kapabacteria bacterium]